MRRLVLSLVLLAGLLAPTLPVAAAPAPHTWVFVIGGVGTTVDSTLADFDTLRQAMQATWPAGSWDMLDLGYDGEYQGANGYWSPVPYSPCDTTRFTGDSMQTMAATLAAFQGRHPADRIVLVGHSLGGFMAYYMASSRPSLRIAANVSIDAPLHGASGWGALANPPECSTVGPLFDELAQIGSAAYADTMSALTDAYNAGATPRNVGIVANDADCLYDLTLPNCPLLGLDWRFSMYAPADWTATYHDPVVGVGSFRQQIAVPHGAILHDYSAMLDVARFLAR